MKPCLKNVERRSLSYKYVTYIRIIISFFNIILSMNHLFEWFLKDENVPQDKKMGCIKIFNPYRTEDNVSRDFKSIYSQLDDFPEVNRSQELIRELCDKAKHLKKRILKFRIEIT